jgi:Tol biopolymer transport system component
MKLRLATAGSVFAIVACIAGSAVANGQRAARPQANAHANGRIAFEASVGKFPQVFTIKPDGTGLKRITNVPQKDPGAENPSWSPDGSTIAFDAPVPSGVSIFTVRAGGGSPTQLPLGVGNFNGDPAYSPDSLQISFDQDVGDAAPTVHGIFIANVDGTNAHRLTTAIATKHSFDTESQWSPDGTKIAFARVKNERQAAIFTVGIDGSGLTQLTPYKLDATSPDWSPNGKTILYNTYRDSPGGKASNIYAISPSGRHPTALTHDRAGKDFFAASFRPSWAPNGKRIVFAHVHFKGKSGTAGLYKMRPDGTHRKRVTHMPPKRFATNPDWGPRSG